jgi:hypothetical protein
VLGDLGKWKENSDKKYLLSKDLKVETPKEGFELFVPETVKSASLGKRMESVNWPMF